MKPVNGRNPLVQSASQIRLPMPYEDDDEDDWEWEDEDVDERELPAAREAQSEDERMNGVNTEPLDYSRLKRPTRKRRMPPMPGVRKPKHTDDWTPPFEVGPDGTVTGPKLGDGDPDRLPEGFDPPPGSAEGVLSIFRPPGNRDWK